MENLEAQNAKLKQDGIAHFNKHVFQLIKRMKASRRARPSINDFYVVDTGDHDYHVVFPRTDKKPLEFSLENGKNQDYVLASRIANICEAMQKMEEDLVYGTP